MADLTIADSSMLSGVVTDRLTNTNNRTYQVLILEDTAATSAETLDLKAVNSAITGIVGPRIEAFAGVVSSTASTWSGTTITVLGTGAYKAEWLCY